MGRCSRVTNPPSKGRGQPPHSTVFLGVSHARRFIFRQARRRPAQRHAPGQQRCDQGVPCSTLKILAGHIPFAPVSVICCSYIAGGGASAASSRCALHTSHCDVISDVLPIAARAAATPASPENLLAVEQLVDLVSLHRRRAEHTTHCARERFGMTAVRCGSRQSICLSPRLRFSMTTTTKTVANIVMATVTQRLVPPRLAIGAGHVRQRRISRLAIPRNNGQRRVGLQHDRFDIGQVF